MQVRGTRKCSQCRSGCWKRAAAAHKQNIPERCSSRWLTDSSVDPVGAGRGARGRESAAAAALGETPWTRNAAVCTIASRAMSSTFPSKENKNEVSILPLANEIPQWSSVPQSARQRVLRHMTSNACGSSLSLLQQLHHAQQRAGTSRVSAAKLASTVVTQEFCALLDLRFCSTSGIAAAERWSGAAAREGPGPCKLPLGEPHMNSPACKGCLLLPAVTQLLAPEQSLQVHGPDGKRHHEHYEKGRVKIFWQHIKGFHRVVSAGKNVQSTNNDKGR